MKVNKLGFPKGIKPIKEQSVKIAEKAVKVGEDMTEIIQLHYQIDPYQIKTVKDLAAKINHKRINKENHHNIRIEADPEKKETQKRKEEAVILTRIVDAIY